VCVRENESDDIYIYKDLWTFCDKMKMQGRNGAGGRIDLVHDA
jgi:hypothetical protein